MATAPSKQLKDYVVGDLLGGFKIYTIVGRNNDFMVCTIELPKGIGVHWITSDTYNFSDQQRGCIAAFNERYDLVKKIFRDSAGPVEALALALFQGLSGNKSLSAFAAIDASLQAARDDASSRTRMVYAVSATVTAVILICAFLLIASSSLGAGNLLGEIAPASLLVCAAFGSAGALASVLQKLRQVEVSYYPGFFTAAFGGCSRILLGSIFGAVALLAAKAGLLLKTLLAVPGGDLLLAVAAGVSERLVPELLQGIGSPTGSRLAKGPGRRSARDDV